MPASSSFLHVHVSSGSPRFSPLATNDKCGTKPLPPNIGRINALSNLLHAWCTDASWEALFRNAKMFLELFSSADVSRIKNGTCVSELNESLGLPGSELIKDLRCGGKIHCTNGLVRSPKTFRNNTIQTKKMKRQCHNQPPRQDLWFYKIFTTHTQQNSFCTRSATHHAWTQI